MNLHITLKYSYYSWQDKLSKIETIKEHQLIIDRSNEVYWGRNSPISLDKYEILKHQLMNGIETFVYLYGFDVPKTISNDQVTWHRARLKDVILEKPTNLELIPNYYKNIELGVYFLLEKIESIEFKDNQTPKIPGQASHRYVEIRSSKCPKDLFQFGKDELLCPIKKDNEKESNPPLVRLIESPKEIVDIENNDKLKDRIISLQEEIIELNKNIQILNEYKQIYQKILNTEYLFNSEQLLENWIKSNIHKISDNLLIIDQQPTIHWPDGKFNRLDLLAMDKETKDLVIIEVKTRKRNVNSGYDQFLRYTAWAKNNLEKLNSTYKKHNLNATRNLSFMIITDYADEEMIHICKESGIKLIKIFGGLGFEKVS